MPPFVRSQVPRRPSREQLFLFLGFEAREGSAETIFEALFRGDDDLGLMDERNQRTAGVLDARRPDHRRPSLVQRCAGADHRLPAAAGAEEIGLRFDGRRASPLRHGERGSAGAERVGESHHGAAVEDAGQGAEFIAHRQFGAHEIGAGLEEAQPEQGGEQAGRGGLQVFDVHAGSRPENWSCEKSNSYKN